jgi:hypothetical protein
MRIDDNKKLFCAYMHKTLTMLCHSVGNISSFLCKAILASVVARECEFLVNLQLVPHRTFCVLQRNSFTIILTI